jgi:hypothetical protein
MYWFTFDATLPVFHDNTVSTVDKNPVSAGKWPVPRFRLADFTHYNSLLIGKGE